MSRAAPFADQDGRLLKQWPTEDGYLMLTIARNMALGHGMSTAEGTLPTNGTQPLATGIWALAFVATDADKTAGVALILALELAASVLAALLLYRLAVRVFEPLRIDKGWALLCAGLWYASPLVAGHTMNALESGIYALLVVATALVLQRRASESPAGTISLDWPTCCALACLLSLAFYARNDAVFLIASLCVVPLLRFERGISLNLSQLPRVIAIGLATVVAASPWLINNVTKFGHLMPISGVAQSASTHFGDNIALAPPVLFEYLTLLLPVPDSVSGNMVVVGALSLVLIVLLVLGMRAFSSAPPSLKPLLAFAGIYTACLVVYYGLIHGAPWFMSRYLFPASPFLALAGVGLLAWLLSRPALQAISPRLSLIAAGTAMLVLAVGLNIRTYVMGAKHMHDQVVHWVLENVPEEDWIGAVQTGTLGYFHDRTINLDGKVNPEALAAVLTDTIPEYVNERRLAVVADWYGLHDWMSLPPIRDHYSLLVADESRNLAVLGRKDWTPRPDHSRLEKTPF